MCQSQFIWFSINVTLYLCMVSAPTEIWTRTVWGPWTSLWTQQYRYSWNPLRATPSSVYRTEKKQCLRLNSFYNNFEQKNIQILRYKFSTLGLKFVCNSQFSDKSNRLWMAPAVGGILRLSMKNSFFTWDITRLNQPLGICLPHNLSVVKFFFFLLSFFDMLNKMSFTCIKSELTSDGLNLTSSSYTLQAKSM